MAEIVVLGGGLSGALAALELVAEVRREDHVTLITEGKYFEFVPSNPWVAVGWRKRREIEADLEMVARRKGIALRTAGARNIRPVENRLDLNDGTNVVYDYLVIATGPELAFDEVPGLGPSGYTQSICRTDHAEQTYAALEAFCANPGPAIVGAVQGASCFGPAYEFALILDTELRRRRLRDRVPMMFVTAEPYLGHLGLDGVGDTRGLFESEFRQRHIKWITNSRVMSASEGSLAVEQLNDDGTLNASHALSFRFAMLLPAFRGVAAVRGIEGLVNPRGFVLVDEHQRNPKYPNVFGVGVCIAIPPVGTTPVPVGVPKTGFMIESMVTATARNIGAVLRNKLPTARATWNAICLADFGDSGIAFIAKPQIPPRNVNWSAKGAWVHLAKVGFERYFLRKIRKGETEPFYERFLLNQLDIAKLKENA